MCDFIDGLNSDELNSLSHIKESSWDKPAGFPSSEQPQPNKEVESHKEPPPPQTETPSETEKSSSVDGQVPEEPKQQSSTPKVTFRVRDTATVRWQIPVITALIYFIYLLSEKES